MYIYVYLDIYFDLYVFYVFKCFLRYTTHKLYK